MARNVKYLSLHRIGDTELRVMADIENGVLPLIQVEESVIRAFTQRTAWPHRCVSLFILEDLQPLARQVVPAAAGRLPREGMMGLERRPVVNVYDLADLSACHIFVNRQIMVQEDYWDKPLVSEALLAHEHAHPLSENATTRSSRNLQVQLLLDPHARAYEVVRVLVDTLCFAAARELFANELAIRVGFGKALFELDRGNLGVAIRSVAGRTTLIRRLQDEVAKGAMLPAEAKQLLLLGDMKAYLDLTIEVAAFLRAGRQNDGRKLEVMLNTRVFPHLEPEVRQIYGGLRDLYVGLKSDSSPDEFKTWGTGIMGILVQALSAKGMMLSYQWIDTALETTITDLEEQHE
jgi:hypothetical protein